MKDLLFPHVFFFNITYYEKDPWIRAANTRVHIFCPHKSIYAKAPLHHLCGNAHPSRYLIKQKWRAQTWVQSSLNSKELEFLVIPRVECVFVHPISDSLLIIKDSIGLTIKDVNQLINYFNSIATSSNNNYLKLSVSKTKEVAPFPSYKR